MSQVLTSSNLESLIKNSIENTWLNRLYAVQRMCEMFPNLLYQGRIQEVAKKYEP